VFVFIVVESIAFVNTALIVALTGTFTAPFEGEVENTEGG
jgi:hypothetical protein